jgi:PKD repeat protein
MNNLNKHYMKKFIVLFLLLCGGVIYFIGSACSGEDSCAGKEEGPVLSGPTVQDCACVTVPKADFTVDKNEYYVGQTVTYIFTGDKGNDNLGIAKNTFLEWTLPGTAEGTYSFLVETSVSVVYPLPGSYTVSLNVRNACWSDRKIMYQYVRIYAWPEK